jgi:hypothetical protein
MWLYIILSLIAISDILNFIVVEKNWLGLSKVGCLKSDNTIALNLIGNQSMAVHIPTLSTKSADRGFRFLAFRSSVERMRWDRGFCKSLTFGYLLKYYLICQCFLLSLSIWMASQNLFIHE